MVLSGSLSVDIRLILVKATSVWVSTYASSGGFNDDFGTDFAEPSLIEREVYMFLISMSFKLSLFILFIR